MEAPEVFNPIVCTIQEIIGLDIGGYDFYEIIVKENGLPGILMCDKEPPLSVGQDFTAEFIQIQTDGKYQLTNPMHEIDIDGNYVLKPAFEPTAISDGEKILKFPVREDNT